MGLDTLDYDYKDHQSAEADKNLAVRFYLDAIHNEEKSKEAGRPVYDEVVFIEKRVRGDRNNVVQRPARDGEERQFAEAYRAFRNNEDPAVSGTPLKEWPTIGVAMLKELQHMGFHTVEQLANASDTVCGKFAGLQTFKQKAANYLAYAKEAAPIAKLEAVATEAKNEAEVLRRQLAELVKMTEMQAAQIEALQKRSK